jgi:ABC-2 type transport system permease protein
MKQWLVLFHKELVESWRNYKWIWIPLAFVMLGIMQPVSTYFLPEILEMAGGLPEGAVIQLPTPTGGQVMMETLGNFHTLGLLILVLAFMGSIAAERVSGVAGMVLVKKVSYSSYVTAKWASAVLLTVVASVIGMMGAWYYTEELIGPVSGAAIASGCLLMCLWLMFLVTVTIVCSAVMRSSGAIAFVTILIAAALTLISSMSGTKLHWSPGKLADYAGAAFAQGGMPEGIGGAVICTMICIALLLIAAVTLFRRKELVG